MQGCVFEGFGFQGQAHEDGMMRELVGLVVKFALRLTSQLNDDHRLGCVNLAPTCCSKAQVLNETKSHPRKQTRIM